ncbi:hypothetical protein ACFWPX_24470 [Nocardia sp. NPDC058518]|uniref:hypothetical protein n=1 Tax=Nocardia sp. NPDC058518 TaxID=3346534 RepID=UPI0036558C69
MYVDWVTYYDAAKKCHDLANDLRAADKSVHDAVKGKGAGMAGDAPGCTEWAQAYDGVARSTLQACTNLSDALTNFGNILYASGYNYGTSNNSNPAPPRPNITAMTEYKVELPSATTAIASMGVRNDGDGEFFDKLLDEITAEFKKLPNADIDALAEVSTVWSTFSASEALSGAKARLETISQMFDNMDRVENRALIQQHLNTISTSAETIVLAGQNIAAPISEFNTGIHETNTAINHEFTMLAAEIAVTIGVAAVGFLFTMGGSGALAVVRIGVVIANAMSGIRKALNAQKLLKILGFSGAFGGAVAAITAFEKVPDTSKVALALVEIIAMKVLLDEGAEEAEEVLDVVTDEAGELIGAESAEGVQIVTAAALEQARQELTEKLGQPDVKQTPKGDIEVWTIPGNPPSTVTYRPFSRSGGATLDFNSVPGVPIKRWHI